MSKKPPTNADVPMQDAAPVEPPKEAVASVAESKKSEKVKEKPTKEPVTVREKSADVEKANEKAKAAV